MEGAKLGKKKGTIGWWNFIKIKKWIIITQNYPIFFAFKNPEFCWRIVHLANHTTYSKHGAAYRNISVVKRVGWINIDEHNPTILWSWPPRPPPHKSRRNTSRKRAKSPWLLPVTPNFHPTSGTYINETNVYISGKSRSTETITENVTETMTENVPDPQN